MVSVVHPWGVLPGAVVNCRTVTGWRFPGNLLDFCSHLLDFFSLKISWIFIFILYSEMFERFLDSKNFFDSQCFDFLKSAAQIISSKWFLKFQESMVLCEDWVLILNNIYIIYGAVATASFLMYGFSISHTLNVLL